MFAGFLKFLCNIFGRRFILSLFFSFSGCLSCYSSNQCFLCCRTFYGMDFTSI